MVLQLKMKINKTEISCRSERAHTIHEKHPNTFLVDRTDYSFRYHDLDSRTLLNSLIEYYATSTEHNTRRALESKHYRTPVNVEHSTITKTNKHFSEV